MEAPTWSNMEASIMALPEAIMMDNMTHISPIHLT